MKRGGLHPLYTASLSHAVVVVVRVGGIIENLPRTPLITSYDVVKRPRLHRAVSLIAEIMRRLNSARDRGRNVKGVARWMRNEMK